MARLHWSIPQHARRFLRTRGQCVAALEAGLVFALVMAYIWRLRFWLPRSWTGILALVIVSHAARGETPGALGFRLRNFGEAFRACFPALAAVAASILGLGVLFHTIRNVSPWNMPLSLAFYCAWGLFQQYVLNGYFVNRLREIYPEAATRVPALAACLFAASHFPNWFLMPITLAGGYFCARVYLKHRNLYVLGLAHGVVGFLLYLAVPDSISRHLYVGPKWFGR
jgi:CAAX prenyl protease-like protein